MAKENLLKNKVKTIIEKKSEKSNYKILFLPPHHPEMNMIELLLEYTKKWIDDNYTHKTSNLKSNLILKLFSIVTKKFCKI